MNASYIELWNKIHYPVTILNDRYHGCYSGGQWIAFPLECEEIPEDAQGEDNDCQWFWDEYSDPVGKGATPDEAYRDLTEKMMNFKLH